MATISDLSHSLQIWTRRLRLQRALIWSARGLVVGLFISLLLGGIGIYQEKLLQNEFIALVISISLVTPLLFGFTAYLWRIQPLTAARHFDLTLHLKERVSTAFELAQHPEHISPELLNRQLEDAVNASHKVDIKATLPLRIRWQENLVALLLIGLISIMSLRGEAWFKAAQQARATQQAIEQQNKKIEEIIKQIESNNVLSDEQKESITAPLKQAQQSLQNNPSLENSVSVLSSTGEKLKELSSTQSQELSQALKEAGTQLSQQSGSPLESIGKDLAQGDNIAAASKLGNIDVNSLSPEEQQQLADQLEAMANALQDTNPQFAEQLNQAANALKSGDTASAQKALNDAAKSLAQSGQQLTYSQSANQAGSQLQAGAGQVLAAGGGSQQANNQGNQSSNQGANQGNSNQSQGGQSNGNNGAGSGSGSDAGNPSSGNEAGNGPITQNNGPSDGGESQYEQIFAPSLLGGDSGPQVALPPTGNNDGQVVGEGPTTPGDSEQSLVPYSEVYSQYEQTANQAIENSDIPAQFTQIIKNYFNSLRP